MGAAPLVSIEEYLTTSYRPDCEYIDGVILDRNLGERDHSASHGEILAYLFNRRPQWKIHVYPAQRVQVSRTRFRVPDVCVLVGEKPTEQIFRTPPFLCVEVLSKDDRMSGMLDRIHDYLKFGVAFVWVIDPEKRTGYIYTADGAREAKDGVLRTANPEITVPLAEIFAAL